MSNVQQLNYSDLLYIDDQTETIKQDETNDWIYFIRLQVQPVKGEVGNMQTLIDALKHIKTLDGTKNEVDIINMSVGQFNLPEGLDEIINELASKKILIWSAGRSWISRWKQNSNYFVSEFRCNLK